MLVDNLSIYEILNLCTVQIQWELSAAVDCLQCNFIEMNKGEIGITVGDKSSNSILIPILNI